jgi:hypothetical protein
MKRPIGVTILAILFVFGAAYGLFLGVVGLLSEAGDPLTQAICLLTLVISFMSATLAAGLWNLEEDARRVAIAIFGLPVLIILLRAPFDLWLERPPLWDVIVGMTLILFYGSPAIYLCRPKVKVVFDQLVSLQLGSPADRG